MGRALATSLLILAAGSACSEAGDCPDGCGPDEVCIAGECRTPCNFDAECTGGRFCSEGACWSAECGNGALEGDEECDSGQLNADSNACTTLCRVAQCGDGLLWAGVEACDDGNVDDGDTCASDCSLPPPECTPSSVICNGSQLVVCGSTGNVATTTDCGVPGCNSTGATPRCNECVPDTVECDGLDLVTCAADGTIASSVSCETDSRCLGAGQCNDASKECETIGQAPDGTPCDEGAGENGNFCDSSCDSAGACMPGTPDCDDGVVCTIDSCVGGAGCSSSQIDCTGTASDCHGDNTCDPAGVGPNCDSTGIPLNEGNACTDCASGTCDTCAGGVCGDLHFCSGASPSAECDADADCVGVPGCEAAQCNRVGCAGVVLEHQACANVLGAGWGVEAPCVSVDCITPDTGTGAGAVDTDCSVSGDTVSITHQFNTSGPDGTSFNIWMHNIADTSWDYAEFYDCTLAGVTGEMQPFSFTITGGDLAGTVRHGQNCSNISTDARYCWMAADFDGDNQMDPFPLDQGLHELSCQITLDQANEHGGFDGFIFTADLGFVPGEAPDGVCPNGDTDFNAGTCETNWGPNTPATSGYCSALLDADSGSDCSTCAGGTCSVCWGGSCRAEGACDGSEPCNTDAECEMLSGACADVPDDCSDVICSGAAFELQACADAVAGDDWGRGKPCESALCGLEGLPDNPTGVGEDCYSDGSSLTWMHYTFNTASPSGTPFYIWMRNIADSDTSASYECTITGATGAGTADFAYDMTDGNWTSRHGTGCGLFDADPNYCWMAADSDTNAATYDPIPLEQGRHVLGCRIQTNGNGHSAGFDGIIFTSDPSYVPDELDGPEACGDSDANFTTDCSNTNWSPGMAPVAGHCDTATVADYTACGNGSGGAGVCCSGTCQASCP